MNISENGVTFDVTLTPKNPKSLKLSMVRSKGLEPSRLLGTTTSRLRVYQFHHERIAGRGTWLKHRLLDKPFLPSRWHLAVFCRLAKRLASPGAPTCGAPGI